MRRQRPALLASLNSQNVLPERSVPIPVGVASEKEVDVSYRVKIVCAMAVEKLSIEARVCG